MCCRALLAVGCRVIIYSHLPGSNFDIKLSRSSQVYPAITMIEVAHKLVLSNQHVKGWLPTSQVVDGIEFVELNQWDRKFFRFCTGKFLTFRKGEGHMFHTKFYDYLVEQRTASSRAAFEASRQALREEAEGDEAPPRKKRTRACRMSDAAVAGEWMAGISSTYGQHRRHDNANAAGDAEDEPDGDESAGEDSE
jgi:hypothetical protein